MEWVRSVYRGDRYKFVARLKRPHRTEAVPPQPVTAPSRFRCRFRADRICGQGSVPLDDRCT